VPVIAGGFDIVRSGTKLAEKVKQLQWSIDGEVLEIAEIPLNAKRGRFYKAPREDCLPPGEMDGMAEILELDKVPDFENRGSGE
jgi:hypothetical protein